MRRAWLAVGLLVVLGCNNFRDLFSAHADVAAEAEGQDLTSERLAAIMGQTKGVKITREAADFVANIWIDYTLFAQAVAKGKNLSDSAAVAETMWPQIATVKGDRWFDTVLTRRLTLSPNAADSMYNAGQFRMVQHILFTVPQTAGATEREVARKKAETTLNRLKSGADFGATAMAESQDFQSARDSGYLPPSARGSFVTSFDSTIWSLAPGAMSGLVETPYGYHIIKRPTSAAASARFKEFLESRESSQLDSLYRDSIGTARGLKLSGSAVALMRAALADPEPQRHSDKKIVEFKGGGFTVSNFLRWVFALPPQFITQLRQATDDQLKEIATLFSQNTILLQQADSAGIGLTAAEWAGLEQQHRADLDSLKMALELGSEITDSSISESERTKLAGLRLDTYFNDLVTGKAQVRKMPATLSAWLRQHSDYKLNEAGLLRALEIAEAKQKADSTAAANDSTRPRPPQQQMPMQGDTSRAVPAPVQPGGRQ
ncbi:MAG: peptidylprolyl isomerase [Gemmatimonadota bacterium]